MRRSSQYESALALLRSVLGAEPIAVLDTRSSKVLWKKTSETTCTYQRQGIDSESQQVRDTKQGDQRNG